MKDVSKKKKVGINILSFFLAVGYFVSVILFLVALQFFLDWFLENGHTVVLIIIAFSVLIPCGVFFFMIFMDIKESLYNKAIKKGYNNEDSDNH